MIYTEVPRTQKRGVNRDNHNAHREMFYDCVRYLLEKFALIEPPDVNDFETIEEYEKALDILIKRYNVKVKISCLTDIFSYTIINYSLGINKDGTPRIISGENPRLGG